MLTLDESDRRKITEKEKPNPEAYAWYAKGLEMQDENPKKALSHFERAIAIDPDYTDAYYQAVFLAGGTLSSFDTAIRYHQQAAAVYKRKGRAGTADYADLLDAAALAYKNNGKTDRALELPTKRRPLWKSSGVSIRGATAPS